MPSQLVGEHSYPRFMSRGPIFDTLLSPSADGIVGAQKSQADVSSQKIPEDIDAIISDVAWALRPQNSMAGGGKKAGLMHTLPPGLVSRKQAQRRYPARFTWDLGRLLQLVVT